MFRLDNEPMVSLSNQPKYKINANNTLESEHDQKLNNVSIKQKNKGVRLIVANVDLMVYCMFIDKYVEGDGSSFAKFVRSLIQL